MRNFSQNGKCIWEQPMIETKNVTCCRFVCYLLAVAALSQMHTMSITSNFGSILPQERNFLLEVLVDVGCSLSVPMDEELRRKFYLYRGEKKRLHVFLSNSQAEISCNHVQPSYPFSSSLYIHIQSLSIQMQRTKAGQCWFTRTFKHSAIHYRRGH